MATPAKKAAGYAATRAGLRMRCGGDERMLRPTQRNDEEACADETAGQQCERARVLPTQHTCSVQAEDQQAEGCADEKRATEVDAYYRHLHGPRPRHDAGGGHRARRWRWYRA